MSVEVQTSGRCLCGAVHVAIAGAPVRMAQCHCSHCRHASGTGHVSNAIFHESDVTITGETKSFTVTTDNGNAYARHFCPTCGSRLFAINSGRPGMIIVHVGLLEDTSWFEPQMVLYARDRAHWDLTTDAVPNHDTAPPMSPLR